MVDVTSWDGLRIEQLEQQLRELAAEVEALRMDAKIDESHGAVAGQVERGVRPLVGYRAVVAYLYHDAARAEIADPLVDSTLLVMWRDRQPRLRNETPLVTLAQAEAMVAAEREQHAAELDRLRYQGRAERHPNGFQWRIPRQESTP